MKIDIPMNEKTRQDLDYVQSFAPKTWGYGDTIAQLIRNAAQEYRSYEEDDEE